MTVDTDTAIIVGFGNGSIVFKLPETAAEYGALSGRHQSYADTTKLRVTAACHHGCACSQPCKSRSFFTDRSHNCTAFVYSGENIGSQTAFFHNGCIPVSCSQIENAGGGTVAGFNGHNAGEFENQPVIEHSHICGFFVNFRHFVFDPEDTGQSAQCIGLTGYFIDLFFQIGRFLDQFDDFIIRARVHIGACPQFLIIFVIEKNAFPHTGCGNSRNFCRIDLCLCEHVSDAATCKFPVVCPVKIHGTREPGIFFVFPFLLGNAQLISVQIEKYGTDTACSGI